MDYIIKRLKERSTWLGLISLATGLGAYINPAYVEIIISAGVSIAGLFGIVSPDKNNDTK